MNRAPVEPGERLFLLALLIALNLAWAVFWLSRTSRVNET